MLLNIKSKNILRHLFAGLVLGATVFASPQSSAQEIGFRALTGTEAAGFVLPEDTQLLKSTRLGAYGFTYERYQQTFGDAQVLGAQLTLYRDDAGKIVLVIGAHYPDIAASNTVRLSQANARAIVGRDIGPEGERLTDLMIDPKTGRYYFRVETRNIANRWVHWIGAQSGQMTNKYNALAHLDTCDGAPTPCGYGVEYDEGDTSDIKDLDDLTTFNNNNVYELVSADGRQETHDQGSTNRPFYGDIATDSDNQWIDPGDTSPAQPALVDAHYYARVADNYFMSVHGFDWVANNLDGQGSPQPMNIQAHFNRNFVNAFWNGTVVAFGDGDGDDFRELVSLDIVGHELAHAVNEFTSYLIYQDESGALDEAFSDIMGTNMEFYADPSGTAELRETASVSPDWTIGEDFDLRPGKDGFRNMADPEEDGDPDHYSERLLGSGDNGGVHSNSGIPNHAYVLLVEGGLNASCASPDDHNSAHCTGSELLVAGIPLVRAERIFFLGFIGLQQNATMCNARDATVAAATAEHGVSSNEVDSTSDAWEAVGLAGSDCGGDGGDTDNDPTGAINGGVTYGNVKVAGVAVTVDSDSTLVDTANNGGRYGIGAVPTGSQTVRVNEVTIDGLTCSGFSTVEVFAGTTAKANILLDCI